MFRTSPRPWSTFLFGGLVLAFMAAALLAQAKNPAPPVRAATLPHPVLDVKELMDVFNKPWYDDMSKDLATQPSEDEEWEDIESDALQMTEIPNLIVLRKVPQAVVPTVQTHAAELQQSALALSKAAKAKDYNEARAAWKGIVQSCNACHRAIAPAKAPQLKM